MGTTLTPFIGLICGNPTALYTVYCYFPSLLFNMGAAARWGASWFCISLFVKLGIGLPQTRSAPEFSRSTSEDAFPVQGEG